MEKNIVDYFKKVLLQKNGQLSMNSFRGHLAELSQRERKYIKKVGFEKMLSKYPEVFLICEEDIYCIMENKEEENEKSKPESPEKETPSTIPETATEKPFTLQASEEDPCTVCSDPIEIFAIGECRHPICFRCSTKLRVLCEDKNCPVCRQKLEMVVFSKKLMTIDQHDVDNYIKDKKYGIAFENHKVFEQRASLLRHVCTQCTKQCDSFVKLEDHSKKKHQLYYCEICVRQCKIFTHERKTYSKSELKKHQEEGDESGSARGGHPLCKFCETRYLDNDELLRHLRLHHCSCFICDEKDDGTKNFQFYLNLQLLNEHYEKEHFTCPDPECTDESGCTAVFRNEIELKHHGLEKHSEKKTKQEKKQEQRIILPHMFEREKVTMPQKVLKVVPDAAGGIHCTGFVSRKIEEMYSFIERDDAPNQFEENVFFDLEACGLLPGDDLREHFKPYDRVSVYALPAARNCKSKWKAQNVEKIEHDVDIWSQMEQDVDIYNPRSPEKVEDLQSEAFPALFNSYTPLLTSNAPPTPSTLAGWSSKAKTGIPRENPRPFVSVSSSSSLYNRKESLATKQANYEVGYIHKNLMDKFGFITKRENEFTENVYFNLDNYRSGMNLSTPIGDLRTVLAIGEKVCYILQKDGPKYQNAKSKYRAEKVWKFPQKAGEMTEPEASSAASQVMGEEHFFVVSTRRKAKVTASDLQNDVKFDSKNSPISMEMLAEKFKKKWQKESVDHKNSAFASGDYDIASHGGTKEQKSTNLIDSLLNADVTNGTPQSDVKKIKQTKNENNIENKMENVTKNAVLASLLGSKITLTSSDDKSETNSLKSVEFPLYDAKRFPSNGHIASSPTHQGSNSQTQEIYGTGVKMPTTSESSLDDELEEYDSTSSEMYSSEEETSEDEWDCPENWCQCQKEDVHYARFMNSIDTCLKNKGLTKLLRKSIAEEMHKKGAMQVCNMQFLEFHKNDNSAYIMFYTMSNPDRNQNMEDSAHGQDVTMTHYVKLNGFYPLESSWFGELRSQNMVTKVSKDLYHISNTCHYITVSRNKLEKVTRVTLHYRPLPGSHRPMNV